MKYGVVPMVAYDARTEASSSRQQERALSKVDNVGKILDIGLNSMVDKVH